MSSADKDATTPAKWARVYAYTDGAGNPAAQDDFPCGEHVDEVNKQIGALKSCKIYFSMIHTMLLSMAKYNIRRLNYLIDIIGLLRPGYISFFVHQKLRYLCQCIVV